MKKKNEKKSGQQRNDRKERGETEQGRKATLTGSDRGALGKTIY